jgi:hypothetical protein
LALCTRSATLLACQDGKGNYYSVRTEGSTFYLRGYDFTAGGCGHKPTAATAH